MIEEMLQAIKKNIDQAKPKLKRLKNGESAGKGRSPTVIVRPHNKWGRTAGEAKEKHNNPEIVQAEAIMEQVFR